MINLFQQLYTTSPDAESYNLYCLNKNLANENINKLFLFLENDYDIFFSSSKIEKIKVKERISYSYWLNFSKDIKGIKVLANADIYFDHTISYLNKIDWFNTIAIVSRKDLQKDGGLSESSEVFYESRKKINPNCSQDAWIYKNKLPDFNCDYKLGYWHCESRFRTSAVESGLNVINLGSKINAIHVDWRNRNQKIFKKSYNNQKIINIPLY